MSDSDISTWECVRPVSSSVRHTKTPSSAPCDFLTFVTVAEALRITPLEVTWQSLRPGIGRGRTSQISQALINLRTSFAFKRVADSQKHEGWLFEVLVNELIVLRHPSVRNHPNLLELQGICWEVETIPEEYPSASSTIAASPEYRVWPVLIFEKSALGNLGHFVRSLTGQGLDFRVRLKLCADIAAAVAHMHAHGVIHGDIKPDNMLVFENKSRNFQVKLADFGYSVCHVDEQDGMFLARSPIWHAPEHAFEEVNPAQARKMDIFSLAMVLLWLLFQPQLSGNDLSPEQAKMTILSGMSGYSSNDMQVLQQLKEEQTLSSMACQLLDADDNLQAGERENLKEYFQTSLVHDPGFRAARIDTTLIDATLTPKHRDKEAELESARALKKKLRELQPDPNSGNSGLGILFHGLDLQAPSFESHADHSGSMLRRKFELDFLSNEYYTCDYRVRIHITNCIRNRVLKYSKKHDASELARCYSTGFGCTKDISKAQELQQQFQISPAHLEERFPKRGDVSEVEQSRLCRYLLSKGHLIEVKPSDIYVGPAQLRAAEVALRHEYHDLSEQFGKDSFVVTSLAQQIAEIIEALGRTQAAKNIRLSLAESGSDATNLLSDRLEEYRSYGDCDPDTGVFYDKDFAQLQLIEKRKENFGLGHALTLQSMKDLVSTYCDLGQWGKAREIHDEIIEIELDVKPQGHPDIMDSFIKLVSILWHGGERAEAQELQEELVSQCRESLGETDARTLVSVSGLAMLHWKWQKWREAEKLQLPILETMKQVLGCEHPSTLATVATLVSTYESQGRWRAAKELRELLGGRHVVDCIYPDEMHGRGSAYLIQSGRSEYQRSDKLKDLENRLESTEAELGEEHKSTLRAMNELTSAYMKCKQLKAAERLQSRMVDISGRILGDDNPLTLEGRAQLGLLLGAQEEWNAAERLQIETLEKTRVVLGDESTVTLTRASDLARTYVHLKKGKEAIKLQTQVLRDTQRIHGKGDPKSAKQMLQLAWAYREFKRLDSTERLQVEALDIRRRTMGDEHPSTIESISELAQTYVQTNRFQEAEELHVEAVNTSKRVIGDTHHSTLERMAELAQLYAKQGRWEEVVETELDLIDKYKIAHGTEDHRRTLRHMDRLSVAYYRMKEWDLAVDILSQVFELRRRVLGREHTTTIGSMWNLAKVRRLQGPCSSEDGLELLVECVDLSVKILGSDHKATRERQAALIEWKEELSREQ